MKIKKTFITICLIVSLSTCLIKTDAAFWLNDNPQTTQEALLQELEETLFWHCVDTYLPQLDCGGHDISDLVLFIGNTGAGKSTFINTLLGHEMGEESDSDDDQIKMRISSELFKGFHSLNFYRFDALVFLSNAFQKQRHKR